ncbi:carbohydrate ABC transporter permease [Streptomyces fuscichromogenes]|uniref:carbohydrate ABC transporter permease n=1 Tax=Streptomyces fuscichromogenes TaxID=1324013 RepID=UPI0038124452
MTLTQGHPGAAAESAAAPAPERRTPRVRRSGAGLVPWLFIAPALLLFTVFKYVPMVDGIRLSLYEVRPFLGNLWVGLDNYRTVFSDDQFRAALGHTLLLAVGGTIGSVIVGFVLALLLEGTARSLWFVRTAVFLPVVTATAVVGEIWRLLYYPTSDGFVNTVLGFLGIGPWHYLDTPGSAIWSVMAVAIWSGGPYNMVIVLAGLTQVDRGLYEAAALDGATTWQRLRYITLPALRPAIAILLTLAAIRSFRTFTEVYVLTGGGPAGSTDVWMTRVYDLGFNRNQIGVASAAATVLFLVTVALTVSIQWYQRRKEAQL